MTSISPSRHSPGSFHCARDGKSRVPDPWPLTSLCSSRPWRDEYLHRTIKRHTVAYKRQYFCWDVVQTQFCEVSLEGKLNSWSPAGSKIMFVEFKCFSFAALCKVSFLVARHCHNTCCFVVMLCLFRQLMKTLSVPEQHGATSSQII